jgi:homocitrate synthase NifV
MERERNIRLVDTTLRDGEQAPGVCFSPEIKIEILKILYDAGIRDFEIGTPAVSEEEQEAIRQMIALRLDANLSVWCRAKIVDIELAYRLGARMVNLSLPVSQIQLEAIGKDEEWAISQLTECLAFANTHFDFVTVGAQDASRSDFRFLDKYIQTAISFDKVKRIRIADTVGIMNPFSVFELFSSLTNRYKQTEFEFHGHNDLGMANANALGAIKGGADLVSVTVNGLGERCGNTPLEELVIALQYSEGIHLDINKRRLMAICELISILSGRKMAQSKPFNGEMCFTHESGIHTRSLLVNELTYQPFSPTDIGVKNRFVYGKHSGSAAIRSLLKQRRFSFDKNVIDLILNEIKSNTRYSSTGLSENEVLEIYHQKFSKKNDSNNFFTFKGENSIY